MNGRKRIGAMVMVCILLTGCVGTGRAYGWFLLIAGLELAGMFLLFSMRVRKKVRSNG